MSAGKVLFVKGINIFFQTKHKKWASQKMMPNNMLSFSYLA